MEKVAETYLYSVINNRCVIKLDSGEEIRSPKSLYLTKDDVLKCMKTAYVYRRFANAEQVRVTTMNLDRLHRPTQLTDEEWKKIQAGEAEKDVVKEPETVVEEEPTVDEVENNDNATVEETVEPEKEVDLTSTDMEVQDTTDTTVEDIESSDEVTEEAEEDTEDSEDNSPEDGEIADELDEEDETGVSESVSTEQANTVKYNHKNNNKKNFYNNKKH